jgi:hypothetical protein
MLPQIDEVSELIENHSLDMVNLKDYDGHLTVNQV